MIHKMFENTDPKAKSELRMLIQTTQKKEAVLGIGRDATFHIPSVWYAEAYSRIEKHGCIVLIIKRRPCA